MQSSKYEAFNKNNLQFFSQVNFVQKTGAQELLYFLFNCRFSKFAFSNKILLAC